MRWLVALLVVTWAASANTVSLSNGLEVSGREVAARVIPAADTGAGDSSETLPQVEFEVTGTGPAPIEVRMPGGVTSLELHRRVADGLYVRVAAGPSIRDGSAVFAVTPGRYVLRAVVGEASKCAVKSLFDTAPLSTLPEAKSKWKFTRVRADRVDGPVPLILIHGLSTDFWEPFTAWAAESEESATFRKHFQLWKLLTPNDGINAAVGFSSAYPGFDESLAAYLNRFIDNAEENGAVSDDGNSYRFPAGPLCILTHSQGGVTARAFLANFPDKAERTLGVVTLSAPHTGSPGATPEWVRYTLASIGMSRPSVVSDVLRGAFADFIENGYLSTQRQSDMDMGWSDCDAIGIGGIPQREFRAFVPGERYTVRTLSARDANLTDARNMPNVEDQTFEPAEVLSTYCGGLDQITPKQRGGINMNKFFLYGAYLEPGDNWQELIDEARQLTGGGHRGTVYNVALRALNLLMAQVESKGHAGVFALSDGFVPLQSQLMLDGTEQKLLYKSRVVNGWEVPVRPFVLRDRMIRKHTLANPGRLRILDGWSHYDTVTGRYNRDAKTSPLFPRVAEDLLSVLP